MEAFYRSIQHSFHFWIIKEKKHSEKTDLLVRLCGKKKFLNRNIFILKHSTVHVDRYQSLSKDREKMIKNYFRDTVKESALRWLLMETEKFIKYQIWSGVKLTSLFWIFLSKVNNSVMKYSHPRIQNNDEKSFILYYFNKTIFISKWLQK